MFLSMRAEPVAPRTIAGGFVLVPVRQILHAWRTCQRSPLGVGAFRTWLACQELVARRCSLDHGRSPNYGLTELARLTGVSEKRARSSVNHLVGAGLLSWSNQVLDFPDAESGSGTDPDDDPLIQTIGGGKGSLAIPRRMLRLLVVGSRPALIATAIGILLRCLSRGRGGFKSRGRVKASWIARAFGVDLRRVKQARKELIDRGWIVPEPTDQWAENSWGRTYHVDLSWDRANDLTQGRRLPPPPPADGPRLPPPESDPEPLREDNHQEPAPGGPAGVEIREEQEKPIPAPPNVPEAPQRPGGGKLRPVPRRPVAIADGAGGPPLAPPSFNDIRAEDLKDTGRLLQLHDQAVSRGFVGSSEADRLRFVAAAEHARAVGLRNPCGLLARIVARGSWNFATQADEDRASRRLRDHDRPGPPVTRAAPNLIPPRALRHDPALPFRSPDPPALPAEGPSALGDVLARMAARFAI